MAASVKPNEIRITRVYDAPVAAVWSAFTEPDEVAQWWGPRGFSLTTQSKELRPGGTWVYTMHGPDGVDYPNHTLYHEVEALRKLVYDHGANDERPPLFRVTALFSESNGKTTLELTMSLESAEAAAATRQFIKAIGGNSTWDRLAEYLDETGEGRTSFVINRSFEAPPEAVFDLWTDPDHLARWLPPAGFDMRFLRADFRAGGSCLFRMSNDAGLSFHALFEYRVIDRPCRIVDRQQFCDAREHPIRHPGLPDFPAAMQTTVLFVPEGERATRVTVVSAIEADAGAAEVAAFRHERSGMTLGWSGSFNKLEATLAELAAG
jgi:uncharacterized protein YndB with AHSA1/START domain